MVGGYSLQIPKVSVTEWLKLEVASVKGWIPSGVQNLAGLSSSQYLTTFHRETTERTSFREMVLTYIDVSPYVALRLEGVGNHPCLTWQVQSMSRMLNKGFGHISNLIAA